MMSALSSPTETGYFGVAFRALLAPRYCRLCSSPRLCRCLLAPPATTPSASTTPAGDWWRRCCSFIISARGYALLSLDRLLCALLICNAFALAVVLGAGLPLISTHGAVGAAIAMVLAELTLAAGYEYSITRDRPELQLKVAFCFGSASLPLLQQSWSSLSISANRFGGSRDQRSTRRHCWRSVSCRPKSARRFWPAWTRCDHPGQLCTGTRTYPGHVTDRGHARFRRPGSRTAGARSHPTSNSSDQKRSCGSSGGESASTLGTQVHGQQTRPSAGTVAPRIHEAPREEHD